LDRILASPGFDKSEQLKSFLRFIVEETIAGRGEQIKAYTIAVDALGRDVNFDPQLDPIVRVEAGRLRRALEHYYAREGRYAPMIIELPIGHYLPVFREVSAGHRLTARLRDQWLQAVVTLRGNAYLILMVVLIAAVVSVGFDLIFMSWTMAKLQDMIAVLHGPPQSAEPSATGGLSR
jgi:hypothetical protein